MRDAGHRFPPVTRTMMVERAWNLGFQGLTNIVDVCVNYLRIKSDQASASA
jgi:DNA-binding response OmpR family regulator